MAMAIALPYCHVACSSSINHKLPGAPSFAASSQRVGCPKIHPLPLPFLRRHPRAKRRIPAFAFAVACSSSTNHVTCPISSTNHKIPGAPSFAGVIAKGGMYKDPPFAIACFYVVILERSEGSPHFAVACLRISAGPQPCGKSRKHKGALSPTLLSNRHQTYPPQPIRDTVPKSSHASLENHP
jgi:hypothetical protein